MKFSELSRYFDRLEETSSRNEMVKSLSELYTKVQTDEIAAVTYLIQGRLVPFFDPTEIGMGEKLVLKAIAKAYREDEDKVLKHFNHLGDLGLLAEGLSKLHNEQRKDLSVLDVHQALLKIATTSGSGSVEQKLTQLADLLEHLEPSSAKHLVRIPVGKMRLGVGDPTILDALSYAKVGDKSLRPVLEAAYNRTSDLGLIANTFWDRGEKGVAGLKLQVGKPVRPQLSERLPNPEAAVAKMGMVLLQPKYDGFRVQIHRHDDDVSIYSRNLESMSLMFPELIRAAKELKAKSFILDGEAIAYNSETDQYLPFQETTKRRRKHGIEEAAVALPLRAFIFDILYLDGEDLTSKTYSERLKIVDRLITNSETFLSTPTTETDSIEEVTKNLLEDISNGLEGVMLKKPDSPYQAGSRNFNWVKLKRHTSGELTDTVDLVLLGYYFGKGKRTAFGAGGLLAGVYDQDKDEFVTITKIGTGLSDNEWREIHRRGDELQIDHKPAGVNSILTPSVWIRPEIVVEVMADEITRSPVHTCGKIGDEPGYALRFPRIVSFRDQDKKPEDATSVKEVLAMFHQQKTHKVAP